MAVRRNAYYYACDGAVGDAFCARHVPKCYYQLLGLNILHVSYGEMPLN